MDRLDTPVLLVDLTIVEHNIARMQSYCDDHGLRFRPHVKTHKIPAIARKQVAAGAFGIACQTLGEAEVMAGAGIEDILISFPLIGPAKTRRVAELAKRIRVSTVADSPKGALGLSSAAAASRASLAVLVECDTGYERTGVQGPEEAAQLAAVVAELDGLRFEGLLTYPTLPRTQEMLEEAKALIEARGLDVATLSSGGTVAAFHTHEIPVITELRAGTYIYGDRSCVASGAMSRDSCALRVLATVVSRPTGERAIIDAGSKTLSSDLASGLSDGGFGEVAEYPGARLNRLSEEHGHVDLSGCQGKKPAIGETVAILPNHACGTVNMHDKVVIHRAGVVEDTWDIKARGKTR